MTRDPGTRLYAEGCIIYWVQCAGRPIALTYTLYLDACMLQFALYKGRKDRLGHLGYM